MTWIESFTFPKLWKPLPVLDCKLDQSKDIVSFGILSLSQLDVDAKSQFFWVFCNGGSVTTGLSKEKGWWVLKSMIVMVVMLIMITCNKLLFQSMTVMVMVIIFWQPLVPKHGISLQEEAQVDSMIVFPRQASTSLSCVDQVGE